MEGPIITISEGKLQGCQLESVLGTKYWAFKGIPFAQPPLGALRFKEPIAPSKWTGIRDASKHAGDIPLQNDTVEGEKSKGIFGSEDCLYLNVYTNAIGHKRPVMFFIYGGGFVEGSGNDIFYRQDYLVTKDIVLVCINYRLGPLGFLHLGHEAPSNQGLKDIIFGLKWVQRNIAAFGGDPDNVTIFGSSAGSSVCHLFTVIPAAKGLFKKAILQSGTAFVAKKMITGESYQNGFKIASLLGLESDDPKTVIEFLRTVPAKDLVGLEGKILTKYDCVVKSHFEFGPIVDRDYTNDPIIPCEIHKLSNQETRVPIIIGHCSNEYLLMFSGKFNDETYEFYNKHIEEILRSKLLLRDEECFSETMKVLREFYLKNQPINKDTIWNAINLFSDITINNNRKLVDLRIENEVVPTYVYEFSYLGNEPTIYNYDHGRQPLQGVSHADELSYIFYLAYMRDHGNKYQYPKKNTKDFVIMERLLRMWYNFALTGNPTPILDNQYITTSWKPVTKENLYYLKIGDDLKVFDDKDSKEREIYEKYKTMMTY